MSYVYISKLIFLNRKNSSAKFASSEEMHSRIKYVFYHFSSNSAANQFSIIIVQCLVSFQEDFKEV